MLLEKLFKEFKVDIHRFNSTDSELFDQFLKEFWLKRILFSSKKVNGKNTVISFSVELPVAGL
jgi:methionyl-tRNA synthetase